MKHEKSPLTDYGMHLPCHDFEVVLRAVEPDDVDTLYIWENDRTLWPFGNTRAPISRYQLWAYARNYDANPLSDGQLRLIIELRSPAGPEPCGILDLYDIDPHNSRAMTGIMIARAYRRRGIALLALQQLGEYARTSLNLRMLGADVAADNLPSLSLFAKAGYTHTSHRPDWFLRPDGTYIPCEQFSLKL